MNPQAPTPPDFISPALPYTERSGGLIAFGILTILLGGGCGLMVLLMLLQSLILKGQTHVGFALLLPAVSTYTLLGIALIWLGIGSIMARRWARALLLIFSWSWLGVGVITLLAMALTVPRTLAATQASMPGAGVATGVMMVVMFCILSVIFVVCPAVWTFFYSRPNVKATCEARDRKRSWTDDCPLPVLGVALWQAGSVPAMVLMAVSGHAIMPFFGSFLTGLPATAVCLIMAGIWGFVAWSIYKLRWVGWWLLVVSLALITISSLVTFLNHNVMEMYQLLGYPQAQLDQMQKTGLAGNNMMAWMMMAFFLPVLGYMIFIRRYFGKFSGGDEERPGQAVC